MSYDKDEISSLKSYLIKKHEKRERGWIESIVYDLEEYNPAHYLSNKKYLVNKINTKVNHCGDMHVHIWNRDSAHLDEGLSEVKAIFGRAHIVGLKAIGLTPHFGMYNIKKWVEYNENLNDYMNKFNDKLGWNCDSDLILIPGMEIGIGHKLVHFYGVNKNNADKVERFANKIKKDSRLESLLREQNRVNDGYGLSDVYMTVTPAHYKSLRGLGDKKILKLYKFGGKLITIETTNTNSGMFQDGIGRLLRNMYGKDGAADMGGSDSHWIKSIGNGYTSFIRPKCKVQDAYDIFDCFVKKETTTNYLRIPNLIRLLINRGQYFSPIYWVKFPEFVIMR